MVSPSKSYLVCFCFLVLGINGPCDQESVEPEANLVLDGSLTKGTTQDGLPIVKGYVKNIGEGSAYQCTITIDAHKSWNNAIVSSVITSLNGGNPIDPSARVYFESLLPNLHSHYEYDYLTNEIKWKRKGQQ